MVLVKNNKFLFGSMVLLSVLLGLISPVLLLAQTDLVSKVDRVVGGELQISDLYAPLDRKSVV